MGLFDFLKTGNSTDVYIAEFKSGNFQNKKEFAKCFLNNYDKQVFISCCQTFAAICTHEDFELLNDFFASADEEHLQVFLTYVSESLSLQSIPFLLALMEKWEDTEIGIRIHQIIMGMLGKYCDEEKADVEECGREFAEFSKTHDLQQYYFKGQVINYGGLTKELIMIAMSCKNANRPFFAGILSEILSNSFGIVCPIKDGEMITGEKIAQIFEFVKKIAAINPKPGTKYYLGKKIG